MDTLARRDFPPEARELWCLLDEWVGARLDGDGPDVLQHASALASKAGVSSARACLRYLFFVMFPHRTRSPALEIIRFPARSGQDPRRC